MGFSSSAPGQNGRYFADNIFNCIFLMKIYDFRLGFHWNLFLMFRLILIQHWFRWWLGAGQATSHYLGKWWLSLWHLYASLGLNELMQIEIKRPPFYLGVFVHGEIVHRKNIALINTFWRTLYQQLTHYEHYTNQRCKVWITCGPQGVNKGSHSTTSD